MNKKQKEAKRKNAQAHLKKVKDLAIQRAEVRAARGPITERRLYKADRVIAEAPTPQVDPLSDVFGEFFAKHFEQGSGIPMTPELGSLMSLTNSLPIIGRKCK